MVFASLGRGGRGLTCRAGARLPESWYSWRYQIPVLAERIRFVAPELRGYNLSEDPQAGYDIEHHPAATRMVDTGRGRSGWRR